MLSSWHFQPTQCSNYIHKKMVWFDNKAFSPTLQGCRAHLHFVWNSNAVLDLLALALREEVAQIISDWLKNLNNGMIPWKNVSWNIGKFVWVPYFEPIRICCWFPFSQFDTLYPAQLIIVKTWKEFLLFFQLHTNSAGREPSIKKGRISVLSISCCFQNSKIGGVL